MNNFLTKKTAITFLGLGAIVFQTASEIASLSSVILIRVSYLINLNYSLYGWVSIIINLIIWTIAALLLTRYFASNNRLFKQSILKSLFNALAIYLSVILLHLIMPSLLELLPSPESITTRSQYYSKIKEAIPIAAIRDFLGLFIKLFIWIVIIYREARKHS